VSKIEIDTSERSLEEQVDAAYKSTGWFPQAVGKDEFLRALRDFAAGKFAKAPEPEVRKPKWADTADVVEAFGGGWFAQANSVRDGAWAVGPTAPNRREAILAFNELFGEKP
jgi:hypothetical protein